MKRFVVLALAFVIMFGLRDLTSHTEASLTLAAIGFVVLAAFTVGELGARLGLPKVTGYIVAGVVLGPQASNILSSGVVAEMRVFNTLALGLIATSAGLELDLAAIRRVWKSLTAMVVLKLPLLIGLVGGTFMAVESAFPSLGVPPEAMFPVALVVAVLGIGTSPAIALAVVNDGRAKGRLTDLLLAIAVVKDLVVVICLAIALALGKAMLDPTAHLDAHVLVHVAEELGSSIFVGAILGGVLIAYMRFVRKQMLLMTVLMILVVAELSATLHLELLLVFIMAGFLVRNFSPYEHDLLEPIERIALPVFVVFFATAGAGVDLIGTWGLLPLALSLIVARIVAFYIAGRLGGFIGGEGPAVIENAWLTWLPQAGVTLGLVFLAAKALPGLEQQVTAIGMALVAINLMVGPITLGMGLTRAGEMGAGSATAHGHEAHGHADGHGSPDGETEEVADTAESQPALEVMPTEEALIEVERTFETAVARAPADLRQVLTDLGRGLESEIEGLVEQVRPTSVAHVARSRALVQTTDSIAERLDRMAEPPPEADTAWLTSLETHGLRWLSRVQVLPEFASLSPLQDAPEHHHERETSTSPVAKQVAAAQRAWMRQSRQNPPLRMMARVAMESRMAEAIQAFAASRPTHFAKVQEQHAAALLDGTRTPDLSASTEIWVLSGEVLLRHAIADGMEALVDALVEHASPLGRADRPRYSSIERRVRQARQGVVADAPRWQSAVAASTDQLRLTGVVAALLERVDGLHQEWGTQALDDIEVTVVGAIDAAIVEVESILTDARDGKHGVDWSARMKAVFPLNARISVRMAAQEFRQKVQPDKLANALVGLVERVPEELIRTPTRVSKLEDPRDLSAEQLQARKHIRSMLLDQRVPELYRTVEALVPQLESAHIYIAEGVEVASYGLSSALRESEDAIRGAIDSLERSVGWLRDYQASVVLAIGECRTALEEEREETQTALRSVLVPRSGVSRVQSNVVELTSRVRTRAQTAGRNIARGFGITAAWIETSIDSPQMRARAMRMGVEVLDGQAMRDFLMPMRRTGLPKPVEAMFSLRPVDDRRQFIARRPVFDRLNRHLKDPDPEAPLLALVSGPRGSGRTSLVNVLQLSARKLTVVRPEEAYHDRRVGIMAAMAKELRCEPDAIESTLTGTRTLVILDNLERFVLPTQDGLADLDALLHLAGTTAAAGTQWVMTIERDALDRLDELICVSGLFNQHARLAPIAWQELERVLRGRARLGGFDLSVGVVAGPLERLQWAPDSLWFQRLAEASEGNLGGAIAAWRSELEVEERKLIAQSMSSRSIPFFEQLSVSSRAILGSLHTWGPMTLAELSTITGLDSLALGGHLQVLCATGLVHPGSFFRIDPALLQPVHAELVRSHLCQGGTP